MIRALTDELTMKIVKLKDKWVEDVITTHTSIDDIEKFRMLSQVDAHKFLLDEGIKLIEEDTYSTIEKNDELVAKWSHKYHIEECENGLKIKIKSWVK